MSVVPSDVEARIAELIAPGASDILCAKRAVLDRLGDGKPFKAGELEWVLVDEVGIPRQPAHGVMLDVPPGPDAAATVDPADPQIVRERLHSAARAAIAELEAEGVLVALDSMDNANVHVPARYGNTSGGVHLKTARPTISAGAYQVARRIRDDIVAIVDVDLFTAELGPLGLDDRARQCIGEALEAFRRGLYLSCVSLLGAVSEGAWWRLAERLRGHSAVDKMLDDERTSAATLIRVTAEEIARAPGMKTVAAELHAHATYLRELRNYGIHPRKADPAASQEHAFTEAGCALLLLETHRYLERLATVTLP